MIRNIGIAIAAVIVLGAATTSLAGSPEGVLAISPSVPLQGIEMRSTGPGTDVHAPSYALTGRPAPESGEWRWVPQSYGGRSIDVIPVR
jgi:hypothetical protein